MLNLYSAHSYGRVCLSKATVDPLFLFHCRLKSSSQPGLGICSFAHRSNQMSDCERFAQIAQDKWATVSNRSGRSEEMSDHERFAPVAQSKWAMWVNGSFHLIKNEQMSDSLKKFWIKKSKILLYYVLLKV